MNNLNQLHQKFITEMIYKRRNAQNETLEVATAHMTKWFNDNPDKFELLYHCWYKDNYLK